MVGKIRRNQKYKIKMFTIFFAALLCFALLFAREGAILYLEKDKKDIKEGDVFGLNIMVDTKGNQINSARGVLVFSKNNLEILEIKKEGSIFKFWDNATSFSNYEGKIVFGGGLPSPGFSGKGIVLRVSMKAKQKGEAKIEFKDGAVLLNDKKGTDILSKTESLTFKIEEEKVPVPAKKKEEKKRLEPPIILTYSSNIKTNEVLYAEGTAPAKMKVIFYIEGKDIERVVREVDVDNKGNWFYSHDKLLPPGDYTIYAKTKNPVNFEISEPSEKKSVYVEKGGIFIFGQFVTDEVIFGILILVLFVAVILLLFYFFYDQQRCAKERAKLMKEIKEANDSVIDGFGVLKLELSRELDALRKLHITEDNISEVERAKRQRLINDLLEDLDLIEKIQNYIRKEVKDIEETLPPFK